MKKSLLLLVFGISVCAANAQTLNWTTEVTVANGSTYGNIRPRVAATDNNIPLVVWGGGLGNEPLYYARGNGAGFGMAMQLTPTNVDPAVMDWQGHDVGSNGDVVYVVFKEQPEMMGNIFIKKSIDGGITWSDTVRVNLQGPYCRFPSIAVTDSDNPAVMFMTFDMNWMSATYCVSNSTDGGQTFPSMPVNASGVGGSDVCDCCPGYMTTEGANQAPVWRRNSNNRRDMWAAISSNSGTSFPTGIDVDNTDWLISACPSSGPSPHLSGDTLTTVFMSGAGGGNRVYISTFSISTQAMGFTTELATNISASADQDYPFIAGNGDTMMVVWQQLDGGNMNTYYTWSLTGAAGLVNNAVLLNTSTSGTQQNPHVAYADGMFHVVFTDLAAGNVVYKSATIVPNGQDEISQPALNAYPVPSSGNVNISLSTPGQTLEVFDIAGKLVYCSSLLNTSLAIVPKQEAGIYHARIILANGEVITTEVIFTE
jgi:hypothetical protein